MIISTYQENREISIFIPSIPFTIRIQKVQIYSFKQLIKSLRSCNRKRTTTQKKNKSFRNNTDNILISNDMTQSYPLRHMSRTCSPYKSVLERFLERAMDLITHILN